MHDEPGRPARPCPVCGSSRTVARGPILHARPALVAGIPIDLGDGAYVLAQCPDCGFGFKDPPIPEAERFETSVDVGGGIIEFVGPLFLFPYINPGRATTVFQVIDLVPKGAKTQQILQHGPGLPAEA